MDRYISDEKVVKRAIAAVQLALDKNKALDLSSIVFDADTGKICEIRPNGEKVIVADKMLKGHYSEWSR